MLRESMKTKHQFLTIAAMIHLKRHAGVDVYQ